MNRIHLPSLIAIGLALVVLDMLSLSVARAADVTVRWTQSTQYVDGSPLPANEITANRVAWGTCNGTAFGTKLGEHKLAPSTSDVITGLAAGKYCIMLFTTAAPLGQPSTESDPSSAVSVTIDAPAPKKPQPPSGGSATVATISPTAYSVIKSAEQLVLLPVGTVPIGTACDTAQGVVRGGSVFNVVPTRAVTFTGSARPLVTLASCG